MRDRIKLSAVILIVVFALWGFAKPSITSWTTTLASSEANSLQVEAPEKLTLNEGKKPGPVTFDHKAHQGRADELGKGCVQCHHTMTNGELKTKAPAHCSSCHLAKGNAKNPKVKGKEMWTREAFHTNCMNCHKQAKRGPTKCLECHARKG